MNDTYRLVAIAPDSPTPQVQGQGLSRELGEFLKDKLECACEPGVSYSLEPETPTPAKPDPRWRRGLFDDGD